MMELCMASMWLVTLCRRSSWFCLSSANSLCWLRNICRSSSCTSVLIWGHNRKFIPYTWNSSIPDISTVARVLTVTTEHSYYRACHVIDVVSIALMFYLYNESHWLSRKQAFMHFECVYTIKKTYKMHSDCDAGDQQTYLVLKLSRLGGLSEKGEKQRWSNQSHNQIIWLKGLTTQSHIKQYLTLISGRFP